MSIQNRLVALIYRAILFVLCLVGLLPSLSFFGQGFAPSTLLYYPILSTAIYAVVLLVEIIVTITRLANNGVKGSTRFAVHFKGALILMMLCNILMLQFIDKGMPPAFGENPLAMSLLHLVVPVLAFLSWLLLDVKGNYRFWGPIVWMLVPFGYYGITLLAALGGIRYYSGAGYPYDFLNPGIDGAGWAWVLVRVLIIAAVFAAVGYVFTIIDRILGGIAKKATKSSAAAVPAGQPVYTASAGAIVPPAGQAMPENTPQPPAAPAAAPPQAPVNTPPPTSN